MVFSLLMVIASPESIEAQGPSSRGAWTVGGSARFSRLHDRGNDEVEIGFEFFPDVGFFFMDGFLVSAGARLGWANRSGVGSASTLGIGPAISYYLGRKGATLLPFVSVRTLWETVRFSPAASNQAPSEVVHDNLWAVSVGAAQFLAKNLAVTGELYSSWFSTETVRIEPVPVRLRNSSQEFGVRFGLRVFLW